MLLLAITVCAQPAPPGSPSVVITEVFYDMPGSSDTLEFIEIHNNNDTNERSLSFFRFEEPITYTFPAGVILPPRGYVIVAQDSVAFEQTFGISAFQWDTGNLPDNGALIILKSNFNQPVDSVNYNSNVFWPDANGNGKSIQLCNDTLPNTTFQHWSVTNNNSGITVDGTTLNVTPADNCSGWVGLASHQAKRLTYYPNPVTDRLTLQWPNGWEGTYTIQLMDQQGKQVWQSVQRLASETQLRWKERLPAGMYLLRVADTPEPVVPIRFIVE
jgi:hypothetical protein